MNPDTTARLLLLTIILPVVALGGGCEQPRTVQWSPNGAIAALATTDGLFFVDRTGQVLTSKKQPAWTEATGESAPLFCFNNEQALVAVTNSDHVTIWRLDPRSGESSILTESTAPAQLQQGYAGVGIASDGQLLIISASEAIADDHAPSREEAGASVFRRCIGFFDTKSSQWTWMRRPAVSNAAIDEKSGVIRWFEQVQDWPGAARMMTARIESSTPLQIGEPSPVELYAPLVFPIVLGVKGDDVFFVCLNFELPFSRIPKNAAFRLYQYDPVTEDLKALSPPGQMYLGAPPELSPDLTRMLYQLPGGEVVVADLNGAEQKRYEGLCIEGLFGCAGPGPDWVDDKSIYFPIASRVKGHDFDIAIVNLEDEAGKQIVWSESWTAPPADNFLNLKQRPSRLGPGKPVERAR